MSHCVDERPGRAAPRGHRLPPTGESAARRRRGSSPAPAPGPTRPLREGGAPAPDGAWSGPDGPRSSRWALSALAYGATASSKVTQQVCRLPLAAFRPLTSGVLPRRPAAVIQYDHKGPGHEGPQAFHWSQWRPLERRERRERRRREPRERLLPHTNPHHHRREKHTTSMDDHTALLSVGHTSPSVMPIDSPHGSRIRRKRQLLGGATAPKPAWYLPCWRRRPHRAESVPRNPSQQNVAIC
jgi:hypothetical protein